MKILFEIFEDKFLKKSLILMIFIIYYQGHHIKILFGDIIY